MDRNISDNSLATLDNNGMVVLRQGGLYLLYAQVQSNEPNLSPFMFQLCFELRLVSLCISLPPLHSRKSGQVLSAWCLQVQQDMSRKKNCHLFLQLSMFDRQQWGASEHKIKIPTLCLILFLFYTADRVLQ